MASRRPAVPATASNFTTHDLFTDREELIAAVHDRLVAHCGRAWNVPDLLDATRPADNVMAIVGEGGMGKSTVVHQLAALTVSGGLTGLPKNAAAVVVDFADVSSLSFESLLLRIRGGVGDLSRVWRAFDLGLATYWMYRYPGQSAIAFARKGSSARHLAADAHLAEELTQTIEVLLGTGGVGLGARLAGTTGRGVARARALRRIRRELPTFGLLQDERDPTRILTLLPQLLAYDLERVRSVQPTLAMVALDTFEQVQRLPAEQETLEDLVCGLVHQMPNVFFVVASRRALRWHEGPRGFVAGGQDDGRWPGLTPQNGAPDQLRIDGFDTATADRYLRERLTRDSNAAIPDRVRRRIIGSSSGSPNYLALSAGLYEQLASAGHQPGLDAFGRPFPQLLLRLLRDMNEQDRQLLRSAALFEAFDEQILAEMTGADHRVIEAFLERSQIRVEPTTWPPYRLHEDVRKGVLECDRHLRDGWTDKDRARYTLSGMHYLENVVLTAGDTASASPQEAAASGERAAAAVQLVLRAASEHRVLAPGLGQLLYTLRELGHWHVMSSLPDFGTDVHPDLSRLITVARLTGRADLEASTRYEQMKTAASDLDVGHYTDYVRYELGNLAVFVGRLEDSDQYFEGIVPAPASPLYQGIAYGRAANALRRSRFAETLTLLDRPGRFQVDRIRNLNMRGHVMMHNACFEQAAGLYTQALEQAERLAAPLWMARTSRHLALALMWFDPDGTLAAVPAARNYNQLLGESVGLAQVNMASAVAHASNGQWDQAWSLLDSAREGFEALSARFELIPVDVAEILVGLAGGRAEQALSQTERLCQAARAGGPVGPPVWAAVTAAWAGRLDWFDFAEIDWLDPQGAPERWSKPLVRLRQR